MGTVKDIRMYRSTAENIAGNPFPAGFSNLPLGCMLHRIAMKLHEQAFSLGDFDHLYINLTTAPVEGGISPAKRPPDKYHPWYRYYDVQITQEEYDLAETADFLPRAAEITERVLMCFCTPDFDAARIRECVRDAVTNGEQMTVQFKEKRTAKNRAVLYLRYTDRAGFRPLLRVWDAEGNLLLERDLPENGSLDACGEILLNAKNVTVKPRRNARAGSASEPVTFPLGDARSK